MEKLCPYCRELIKAEAIKCKNCHEPINQTINDRKPLRVPDKTVPEHDIEKDKTRYGFADTFASIIIALAIIGFISASIIVIVESSWLIFTFTLSSLITLVAIYCILVLLNGIAINTSAARQLLNDRER